MRKTVVENHNRYLEREALYKSFGYDVEKERVSIIEQARPLRGKILEAGTGKGHFALALAKQGHKFTTFDISEKEQKFARLNLEYFGLSHLADFRIENGEHLSFKDKSFDVIFSVNTIHHLLNPYKFIDQLTRALSSEGKIILSDFNKKGFKIMEKIHATEGKKHEVGKTTLPDINKYLKSRGFNIKKHRTNFQEISVAYYKAMKK